MKVSNDDNTIPVEFEKKNIKEATTKLSNLIKFYPYHPIKSKIENIEWLGRIKFLDRLTSITKYPFCGIIEKLHRIGFPLYSNWLEVGVKTKFRKETFMKARNALINHFTHLFKTIRFEKTKGRIKFNNEFKELRNWIYEMYKKIDYVDYEVGWGKEYKNQLIRRDFILKAYQEHRKNKEERLQKVIKRYEEMKIELKEENSNDDNFYIAPFLTSEPKTYRQYYKIGKNSTQIQYIENKLSRYNYDPVGIKVLYTHPPPIEKLFYKVFLIYPNRRELNILTPKQFDVLINEILKLFGHSWVSCINGKLLLIGNSIEEIEEKRIFRELNLFPKVKENLENAYKHLMNSEWNDVPLYCCKSIEKFYKDLLQNKPDYENKTLKELSDMIIKKKENIFKNSISGVLNGISHLILSGINLVGTLRNKKDSAHGNLIDVEEWEANMSYSYTILLLRTLLAIV